MSKIKWSDDRHFALPSDDPTKFIAVTGPILSVDTKYHQDGPGEVTIRLRVRDYQVLPNASEGSDAGSDADDV